MFKIPAEPMLLRSTPKAFDSPEYAFELKFDGVRMTAYVFHNDKRLSRFSGFKRERGGNSVGANDIVNGAIDVRLFNRRLNERTDVYTEIAEELASLKRGVILDGEVAAFAPDGRPDFYRVMKRDRITNPSEMLLRAIPARYMVFDILYLDGEELIGRPYRERRSILERFFSEIKNANAENTFETIRTSAANSAALNPAKQPAAGSAALDPVKPPASDSTRPAALREFKQIALCDSFPECGEALYRAAARENLEGIIAKRLDGLYTPGARTDAWLKIKNPNYTRPKE